ncbi:MAG: TetR/AcrR family transcriptional regulator [Elusimicrobiota bacterium]|jgi:AcrR family transcriptional regulator|nr:TetR/AcrR family transcriptional regulator [Elusimicrobiota bacterium]
MAKNANAPEHNTKEKILETAFDLFAQRGMKDISMREIASACGVTKPVIYYYFKDKDALCCEIVKNFERRQNDALAGIAAKTPRFDKFLERLFTLYLDNPQNKRMVAFMTHLHSYAAADKNIGARLHRQRCHSHDFLKDTLSAQVKEGAIAPEMREIARHMIFANIMHMVLNAHHEHVKFTRAYPSQITKAILKAIDYKGDSK